MAACRGSNQAATHTAHCGKLARPSDGVASSCAVERGAARAAEGGAIAKRVGAGAQHFHGLNVHVVECVVVNFCQLHRVDFVTRCVNSCCVGECPAAGGGRRHGFVHMSRVWSSALLMQSVRWTLHKPTTCHELEKQLYMMRCNARLLVQCATKAQGRAAE